MTDNEIYQQIIRQETGSDRVRRLAAEHNADLPVWCTHRRRCHRLVTDAVIAASVIAFVVVTTLPKPDGHYISNAQSRTEILHTIDQTTLFANL